MARDTHRDLTWGLAACAVGLAALTAVVQPDGTVALLVLPLVASLCAVVVERMGLRTAAGVLLALGIGAVPLIGAMTQADGVGRGVELVWMVSGLMCAGMALPLSAYCGIAVVLLLGEALALAWNPMVGLAEALGVSIGLAVAATLIGLRASWSRSARRRYRELQVAHDEVCALAQARLVEIEQFKRALSDSNQQLVHQSRLATLGELTAGIVHELNNPLTSVLLSAEALAEDPHLDPDEAEDALRTLLTGARACQAVVERALDFGRLQPREPRKIDVSELVDDAVRLTASTLRRGRVTLSLEAREAAAVLTNDVQVVQILVNLLSNASHALYPSGGRVRVAWGVDGADVWVDVVDDGPGVPEAARDMIFAPFYTSRPSRGGTGLGLPISLSVARDLGGTLVLLPRSAGQRGAWFQLRLPKAEHAVEASQSAVG